MTLDILGFAKLLDCVVILLVGERKSGDFIAVGLKPAISYARTFCCLEKLLERHRSDRVEAKRRLECCLRLMRDEGVDWPTVAPKFSTSGARASNRVH